MKIMRFSQVNKLETILSEPAVYTSHKQGDVKELMVNFVSDFNSLDDLVNTYKDNSLSAEEQEKNLIRLRAAFMCIENHISEVVDILGSSMIEN